MKRGKAKDIWVVLDIDGQPLLDTVACNKESTILKAGCFALAPYRVVRYRITRNGR